MLLYRVVCIFAENLVYDLQRPKDSKKGARIISGKSVGFRENF